MGLLMSARHEEQVHQLAATLDAPDLLVADEGGADDGSDGGIEVQQLSPGPSPRRLPEPEGADGTDGAI